MRVSKKTVIHPGTVLENGLFVHSRRHAPGTPEPCSSPGRPETPGGTHTCCGNCPDCTCRSTDTAEQPRVI
jgi:hypothetical protein